MVIDLVPTLRQLTDAMEPGGWNGWIVNTTCSPRLRHFLGIP